MWSAHYINKIIDTPYYHCTPRCVCQYFLCSKDSITGHKFEYQRG